MISLILTTYNRAYEFKRFCDSLTAAPYLQLILIDQNEQCDYVSPEIDSLVKKGIEVVYLKTNRISLSKARNIGLSLVRYKIVGFPDDDCFYSSGLLNTVVEYFKSNPSEYLFCASSVDDFKYVDNQNLDLARFSKYELLRNLISYTCFFNFNEVDLIYFDEKLGVGTYFSSAEETDYAYRFLSECYKNPFFKLSKSLQVCHPIKSFGFDIIREKSYALGLGAFSKKNFSLNIFYIYNYYLLPLWIKPFGLFILSFFKISFLGMKKALLLLIFRNMGFCIFKN